MTEYIPLGSIVLLKGAAQKLVIIARALNVKKGDEIYFFDYGAALYPEGVMGDQIAYFNKEDISRVVFEGYSDIDNENMVENINRYIAENPDMKRGHVKTWNQQ